MYNLIKKTKRFFEKYFGRFWFLFIPIIVIGSVVVYLYYHLSSLKMIKELRDEELKQITDRKGVTFDELKEIHRESMLKKEIEELNMINSINKEESDRKEKIKKAEDERNEDEKKISSSDDLVDDAADDLFG